MVVFIVTLLLTSRVGAITPLGLLAAASLGLAWQLIKPDVRSLINRSVERWEGHKEPSF
jgi:hypothetical protein